MGANGITDQKKRGKGDIGGPDLPDGGLEGGLDGITDLANSLDGESRADLARGYCEEGKIDRNTRSDRVATVPGTNNVGSRIKSAKGNGY